MSRLLDRLRRSGPLEVLEKSSSHACPCMDGDWVKRQGFLQASGGGSEVFSGCRVQMDLSQSEFGAQCSLRFHQGLTCRKGGSRPSALGSLGPNEVKVGIQIPGSV